MPKFRKKPLVIEAVQWTEDNWDELEKFCPYDLSLISKNLIIKIYDSNVVIEKGDWLVKEFFDGMEREWIVVHPEVFKERYEKFAKKPFPKNLCKHLNNECIGTSTLTNTYRCKDCGEVNYMAIKVEKPFPSYHKAKGGYDEFEKYTNCEHKDKDQIGENCQACDITWLIARCKTLEAYIENKPFPEDLVRKVLNKLVMDWTHRSEEEGQDVRNIDKALSEIHKIVEAK